MNQFIITYVLMIRNLGFFHLILTFVNEWMSNSPLNGTVVLQVYKVINLFHQKAINSFPYLVTTSLKALMSKQIHPIRLITNLMRNWSIIHDYSVKWFYILERYQIANMCDKKGNKSIWTWTQILIRFSLPSSSLSFVYL